MRHLETMDLWLQKEVAEGHVEVLKTPGDDNPADALTKYVSQSVMEKHLEATE